MLNENVQCPCQTTIPANRGTLLNEFETLRERCPALSEVFVPDRFWSPFREKALTPPDGARHRFILLGAFENHFLERITSPIHRYVLEQNKPKSTLTKQYRKDLIESWMLEETALERHRKARIFQGRLAELRGAAWLEDMNWAINGLEALGGRFDIEATSTEGKEFAVEVKFIGQEDGKFEEILESLSSGDGISGGCANPYDGYNFLLFKVFEAAKQLSGATKDRLALITVCNMTWDFLEMQIKDGWMRNRPLKFYDDQASPEWKSFLSRKKMETRYACIESELDWLIGCLQELWIVKQGNYLDYTLESKLKFSGKGAPSLQRMLRPAELVVMQRKAKDKYQ